MADSASGKITPLGRYAIGKPVSSPAKCLDDRPQNEIERIDGSACDCAVAEEDPLGARRSLDWAVRRRLESVAAV